MSTSSMTTSERTRKTVSAVFRRMEEPGTGVGLAAAMGVSESTISRIKNDHLESVINLITHLGLKMVPIEYKCVDRAAYDFLTQTHQRIMQVAPQLVWDTEEDE